MTPSSTPQTPREWHRRVLALSLPILLANLSVPLVGLVDTAVAGRLPDARFLAAVTFGSGLFSLLFWAVGFLKMTTIGLLAQALGRGDRPAAQMILWRAFALAALLASAISLAQGGIFHLALKWVPIEAHLLEQVRLYYDWRIASAPATLGNYVILGSLVGLGLSRDLLRWQLLLNLSNIALSVLLGLSLGWQLKGIALASVISEYLALGYGLWLLNQHLTLRWPSWAQWSAPGWAVLWGVNRDVFLRNWALSFTFYWFNTQSASLGTLTLAANGLLLQLAHLSSYALDGFAHASEHLCGRYYGSRDRAAFEQSMRYAGLWLGASCALMVWLLWLFTPLWLTLLSPLEAVVHAAEPYRLWLCLMPLCAASAYLLDGVYTGTTQMGAMRNAVLIGLLSFLLLSPWAANQAGNHGLWAALCLAMLVRSAMMWWHLPHLRAHFHPKPAA